MVWPYSVLELLDTEGAISRLREVYRNVVKDGHLNIYSILFVSRLHLYPLLLF